MPEKVKTPPLTLNSPLSQAYIVYATILAFKLVIISPLAIISFLCKGTSANAETPPGYLGELKNLFPFLIVAAAYITTAPDLKIALNLFRTFAIVRLSEVCARVRDMGIVNPMSQLITCYMAAVVVQTYAKCL